MGNVGIYVGLRRLLRRPRGSVYVARSDPRVIFLGPVLSPVRTLSCPQRPELHDQSWNLSILGRRTPSSSSFHPQEQAPFDTKSQKTVTDSGHREKKA